MTHQAERTPQHPFGRPLPADPQTLSDAFGLLLREALARRGWVLVPMLFYVVLVGHLDALDAAEDPVVGVMLAALIGAATLGSQLGSQRARMVGGALLGATVVLCVDPTHWALEPAQFLPLTGLLLCLLVPPQHDRSAAVTTTVLATVLLPLGASGEWFRAIALPPAWPAWTAATLACCGVFFAARSRTWPLTLAAVVLPPVAHGIEAGLADVTRFLWALVFVHLLGLAARSASSRGRDPLGAVAAMIHRRPVLAPLVLAGLVPHLLYGCLLGGVWSQANSIMLRTPTVADLLVVALVGIGGACLAVLGGVRANSFGRLAVLPIVVVGLASVTLVPYATLIMEGLVPSSQVLTEFLAIAPGMAWTMAPVLFGTALAVWVGRAPAVAVGAVLGGMIWLQTSVEGSGSLWRELFVAGALMKGIPLLLTWGASTRGDRRALLTWAGAGVAVALLLLTDWSSWITGDSWNYAPNRVVAFELFRTRLADFAFEAVALGLGVVLFVDALRLGRAIFTTCPVPEWHVIRTDFAPERPEHVA